MVSTIVFSGFNIQLFNSFCWVLSDMFTIFVRKRSWQEFIASSQSCRERWISDFLVFFIAFLVVSYCCLIVDWTRTSLAYFFPRALDSNIIYLDNHTSHVIVPFMIARYITLDKISLDRANQSLWVTFFVVLIVNYGNKSFRHYHASNRSMPASWTYVLFL